jgi:hypothetical protein
MGNMERKEPVHLQERKPSRRETKGNNNLTNTRNGVESQLSDWKSTTHRPGFSNPGSFSPKRWGQQHTGRVAIATSIRRAQLDTTSGRVPQVKF